MVKNESYFTFVSPSRIAMRKYFLSFFRGDISMNHKESTSKMRAGIHFLWLVVGVVWLIAMTLSPSVFAQKNVPSTPSKGAEKLNRVDAYLGNSQMRKSPEWRLKMSDIFLGSGQSFDADWKLAAAQLRVLKPEIDARKFERFAIQRIVVGHVDFAIFYWLEDIEESRGYSKGDPHYFSGTPHKLLMTRKKGELVFSQYFDGIEIFEFPQERDLLADESGFYPTKDIEWEQQCKRSNIRKNMNVRSNHYRICPSFLLAKSRGHEVILFSTIHSEDLNARYYSFDPKTGSLGSILEVHAKFGNSALNYDSATRSVYVESHTMEVLPKEAQELPTLRQVQALKAFMQSSLGKKFCEKRPCIPGSGPLGNKSYVVYRADLGAESKFHENSNAVLGSFFLEQNNSYALEWLEGENNRIQELENKSWEFRAIWICNFMGTFSAVNEPQRILNAFAKIPAKAKQEIVPSDIALYWAALGMEGLLKAFPSPLLEN